MWYNGSTIVFQTIDKSSILFTRIMKKFNTFKIWFGKKLIDLGFSILLRLDDRDWNPKTKRYPGSVKQAQYMLGTWLVMNGIKNETKGLNQNGWPGYTQFNYYDKNYHLGFKKPHRKRRKNNGNDDFNNWFPPDWDGNS